MQEELEELNEFLRSDKQNLAKVTSDRDRLRSWCDEKDKALQAALLEKRSMEVRLAKLGNLMIENNTKKDVIGADSKLLQKLQDELKLRSEQLHAAEENIKKLETEKLSLEQRMSELEKTKADEMDFLEKNFEQERKALKFQVLELEKKLEGITQELAVVELTLEIRNSDLASLQHNLKELEELREMKEDIDRKNEQTAAILKMQGAQLAELEVLYKEEQVLRKRYFNTIEVEHPWKDDKPKQHIYDRVFDGNATQEDVFEDTKYLMQSSIDGYNVCIFAYGQTGSGKTFTIYGSENNPGLTPRAIAELFKIIKRDGKKFSFSLKVLVADPFKHPLVKSLYDEWLEYMMSG